VREIPLVTSFIITKYYATHTLAGFHRNNLFLFSPTNAEMKLFSLLFAGFLLLYIFVNVDASFSSFDDFEGLKDKARNFDAKRKRNWINEMKNESQSDEGKFVQEALQHIQSANIAKGKEKQWKQQEPPSFRDPVLGRIKR